MVDTYVVRMAAPKRPRMIRISGVFALFVERERDRKGWTQARLVEAIEAVGGAATEGAIGHWENARKVPSATSTEMLFRALGLSVSDGFQALAACARDIEERGAIARAIRARLEAIGEPVPGAKRAWVRRADVPDSALSGAGSAAGAGARRRRQSRRKPAPDHEQPQPADAESRSPGRPGSPR